MRLRRGGLLACSGVSVTVPTLFTRDMVGQIKGPPGDTLGELRTVVVGNDVASQSLGTDVSRSSVAPQVASPISEYSTLPFFRMMHPTDSVAASLRTTFVAREESMQ